ncbi:MAG TPA: hypothetical protein VGI39_04870 [Polyangiaceae bacterium]
MTSGGISPEGWKRAEERRKLSDGFERVVWPPRVGERVHYNSGWASTSWTGVVRAVVDDEVVVFLSSLPAYAGSRSYKLETKAGVLVFGREGALRYGPLPRPLCEATEGNR